MEQKWGGKSHWTEMAGKEKEREKAIEIRKKTYSLAFRLCFLNLFT